MENPSAFGLEAPNHTALMNLRPGQPKAENPFLKSTKSLAFGLP